MDDIETIKQKINIVDLIQEYIPLKKAGVNFKAPCPFHQEKTPSFVVSPERGIWHCFGCNLGGDIFRFLMEKEGVDFPEALETLAKRAGVTLKKKRSAVSDKRERLFEAHLKAAQFFNHLLTTHPLGKKALDYLHSRGVTDTTIKEFNLGYAPNSWDSLHNFLKKRGFKTEELVEAGLIVASNRGGYDRFRGRVIFPLVDIKNQIHAFAGRVLDKGEPKYLNSPQSLIFDKSEFLFGLNLSKSSIKQQGFVILTEGEMDMIMSYQGGVKNVVASKGTALTEGQVNLIKRFTDNIYLCFDKDLAGDSASRRGIELADQAGLNIKVIKLPTGKDPAELVTTDLPAWETAVKQAEEIYDYYLRSVSGRYDLKTADGKKQIASELLPIWDKISDSFVKEHYIQKLAAILEVEEDFVRKSLANLHKSPTAESGNFQTVMRPSAKNLTPRSRKELLEEYLLVILLKIPEGLTFVPSFPETLFSSDSFRSIYVLLVLYLDKISFKTGNFKISEFASSLPSELTAIVDRLYLSEIDDKLQDTKLWQDEVKKVTLELKRSLVKASLEKLSLQIKSAQSFGKIEELAVLNRRFRDLSLKLKNL